MIDDVGHSRVVAGPRRHRDVLGVDYEELDPDVFGEELAQPAYQDVERIAVVVGSCRGGPDRVADANIGTLPERQDGTRDATSAEEKL